MKFMIPKITIITCVTLNAAEVMPALTSMQSDNDVIQLASQIQILILKYFATFDNGRDQNEK